MVELTVGYVSGFIATGVFLAHFFVPLFLALVMVAVLRDNNSAVTWSVAARFLQSSKWPSIMRTDSSGSKGVRKPVLAVSKLQTITMFLITISSVITPLGLYEAISPNQKPVSKTFGYVKDPSPLGFGTPPRPEFATTRLCGGRGPGTVPCPGSKTVDRSTRNNTTMTIDYDLDVTVPDGLTKLYGSGMNAQSATLSSIWDIQWRQYTYDIDEDKMINKGEKYLVGATRTASTVALDNKVQLVEGLVVDTRANSSGIGFRNHSIPQGVNEGGTWSEDILWVEPETVCVDTNLTLDFTLGHDLLELIQNLRLTDRGGFANLGKLCGYSLIQTTDSYSTPSPLYRQQRHPRQPRPSRTCILRSLATQRREYAVFQCHQPQVTDTRTFCLYRFASRKIF